MTYVEMAVAVCVLGLLGAVFFQVLNSGMILFSKNTAVNAAHEEARQGVNRLTRDIHASIAVPQLRDTGFTALSSNPVGGVATTAAGVSFQLVAYGPQYVWKDPSGTGPILVKGITPTEGMHFIAPFWNVEDDVIKVSASPTTASHHNVWLANGGESIVSTRAPVFGSASSYSIIYYTYRVMYLVRNGSYVADSQGRYTLTTGAYSSGSMERYKLSGTSYVPDPNGTVTITPKLYTSGATQRYRYENGELHRYGQSYANSAFYWKDEATVAKYISTPLPFYVPLTASGAADTKYIGVKLSARDPQSSNRGYLATAALLDTQIDYRSRIAFYQ